MGWFKRQKNADKARKALGLENDKTLNDFLDSNAVNWGLNTAAAVTTTTNFPLTIGTGGALSGGPIILGGAGGGGGGTGTWNTGTGSGTGTIYPNYPQYQMTVPLIVPFGANKQKEYHSGLVPSILPYHTVIVVPSFELAKNDVQIQQGDIIMCLDNKKHYRCTGRNLEGYPNVISNTDVPTWEEVTLNPDMTVTVVEPEPVPVKPVKERKKLYDAFEKNLEVLEGIKDDIKTTTRQQVEGVLAGVAGTVQRLAT